MLTAAAAEHAASCQFLCRFTTQDKPESFLTNQRLRAVVKHGFQSVKNELVLVKGIWSGSDWTCDAHEESNSDVIYKSVLFSPSFRKRVKSVGTEVKKKTRITEDVCKLWMRQTHVGGAV